MRIGINGWFLRFQNTGIGQYMRSLLKNLDSLRNDHEYLLFVDESTEQIPLTEKFKYIQVEHPYRFLHKDVKKTFWEQHVLYTAVKNHSLDFLHIPYFAPPILKRMPVVMTIHDSSPLRFSLKNMGRVGVYDKLYRELFFSRIKKADEVIVVSAFLKTELLDLIEINADKITVIPISASEEYRPIEKRDEIKRRIENYGITKKYIFCVGDPSYNKNLFAVMDAYCSLPEEMKKQYDLVICGGSKYSNKYQTYASQEPDNRIKQIGYATSDGDLPYLYNGAELFVFPSRYEGFGIPPLEAMKCGVPVICNNSSNLKAVVADAGMLIDTENAEEMCAAIIKVLSDSGLQKKMSEKELERAAQFSWKKTAEETVKVYEKMRGA
jgi:glycosyltransferase involved in cell wall biosynthesis